MKKKTTVIKTLPIVFFRWAKPLMNNKFKFKGEIDMRKAEVVSRSQQFTPAAAPAKEGRPTGSRKQKKKI